MLKNSQYFNNPQFAQAASNLTALFAPPSGSDAAGWATANAKKEEASRLAQLFSQGTTPSERASLIGVQNYGQTPQGFTYEVDQTNLTSRSNNAADNQRALQTNQADNQRSMLGQLYQPLNPGQVRPELPGDIAGQYGMPGVTVPQVAGAPKPLSEDEFDAAQKRRLMQSGQFTDQMILDTIIGTQTPVEAIGPNGAPQFMSPGAAIRQGARPYDRPSPERLDNFLAVGPDGSERRFLGYAGPDGRIRDSNTGEPVPNVVRREGTGGGMNLEVDGQGGVRLSTGGSNTVARKTDLQRQAAENARSAGELNSLFENLRSDDLGVAGGLNELLTNYAGQISPDLARTDVAAARTQLRATTLNMAKSLVGDERLSDADRNAANEVMVSDGLGESLPGARAKLASLIALSAYREKFARNVEAAGGRLPPLDRDMLQSLVAEGAISPRVAQAYESAYLSRSSAAPPVTGAAPSGSDDIPTVAKPAEAYSLPPGTRFRTPDGRVKVRP